MDCMIGRCSRAAAAAAAAALAESEVGDVGDVGDRCGSAPSARALVSMLDAVLTVFPDDPVKSLISPPLFFSQGPRGALLSCLVVF